MTNFLQNVYFAETVLIVHGAINNTWIL